MKVFHLIVLAILLTVTPGVFADDGSIPSRVMFHILENQPVEMMGPQFSIQNTKVSDPVFDILLRTEKKTYCKDENISIIGFITEDGVEYNASKHDKNHLPQADTIDLYLYRSSANSKSLVLITNVSGQNITSSGNFSSSDLKYNQPGKYKIVASFKDYKSNIWNTSIDLLISPKCIDRYLIYTDKAEYYGYSDRQVTVYVEAQKYSGGEYIGVPNVEFNWSMRSSDESVYSSHSYVDQKTDSTGKFNTSVSVPSSVGRYIIEVNDFAAKSTFFVLPFEVDISMKDDTGSSTRATYAHGQKAKLEVKVTINGSLPESGTFYFSGNVIRKDGKGILSIPSTQISTSTFKGSHDFDIDSTNFSIGSYMANITVIDDTNRVASATFFDVRNWKLSVEVPKDSGFLFGSTGFAGSNVNLVMKANSLATGAPITGLEAKTNVTLLNTKGESINDSINVRYSNKSSGYIINLSMPMEVGTYVLRAKSTYSAGDTLTTEKIVKVTDFLAYASPADRTGEIKEIFGAAEKIYIVISAKNSSSSVSVDNMSLIEVRDEDGNPVAYTNMTWADWSNSSINDNTTGFNWGLNKSYSPGSKTLSVIALDNPREGGLYFVVVEVNGQARARTKFSIDPYKVCGWPKPENEDWYRWQFAISDPVRFEVTVTENRPKSGKSFFYFDDFRCGKGGSSGTEIQGATVTVSSITNEQAQKEIPISEINITRGVTDKNGQAYVTIIPKSGNWSGGWYQVVFKVTGSDNVTTGKGYAGFEARRFYIWGHGVDENGYWKWNFRPNETVNINVEMFDAEGGGWWRGGDGLNGQATAEKILYHGTPGNWIWPPIEYEYQGELPTAVVKNGQGTFNLTAPQGRWKTGEYSVVIKGSNEAGEEDYGWAWFTVRLWDAWGRSVDNETFERRYWDQGFATDEGVGIVVDIRNAGDWWSWSSSKPLEEAPVTIGIQKIQDYSSWPPQVMDESNYTYDSLKVNKSFMASKMWNYPRDIEYLKNYTLMLNPTQKWPTGYHNVVLNLTGKNGSQESGRAWFNVRAFYVNTIFVDSTGGEIWTSKGGKDMYFNVTTTNKYWNQWGDWVYKDGSWQYVETPYTDASPVNTTVEEIIVWSWSEDSWEPMELAYPGDLEVYTADGDGWVNGSEGIKVNRTDGKKWDAGWYNGEVVLKNEDGEKDRGYMWFEVRPFYVWADTVDENGNWAWELSSTSNVTMEVTITDPETWDPMAGNFEIVKIVDETWEKGYNQVELDGFEITEDFSDGVGTVTVSPPGGKWDGGYHNIMLTVNNTDTGDTANGWGYFKIVPFKVRINSVNGDTDKWSIRIKPRENMTINVTAYDPKSNGPVKAKLEKVGTWRESYEFTTEDGDDYVNGTEEVTVYAPSDGWEQGYHYINLEFEDDVREYLNFDVRSFAGWAWAKGTTPEANLSIEYEAQESWDNGAPSVNVNITKVELRYPDSYYGDWTEVTANASFVDGLSSGKINVTPPSGVWAEGWYSGRLHLVDSDTGDTGKFSFWFEVTTPQVYIYYPYAGAKVSGDIWLEAKVRNDHLETVKNVSFTLINSSGTEFLLGNGTQPSWSRSYWRIQWDASQYDTGTYTMAVKAFDAVSVVDTDTTGEFNLVKPANATFSGNYHDYVSDADDDTYYDYLFINVTVNVTEGGEFYLGGSLYSQDGKYIAWGRNSYPYPTLEKGLQNLTLSFYGTDIRRSKVNGPYLLDYVYLYDTSSWTRLEKEYDVYSTSAYNYTQFQRPPAELTGNITTSMTDEDGDGIYEILTVSVGVEVFKTGDYRVGVELYDQSNWMWENGYSEGLTVGTHYIDVNFNTNDMSEGNWTVYYTDLYKGWWEQWLGSQKPDHEFELRSHDDDLNDDGVVDNADMFSVSGEAVDSISASDQSGNFIELHSSGTLNIDGNGDEDLNDDPEDYPLYNGLYVIDTYTVQPFLNATKVAQSEGINDATIFNTAQKDSKGYGALGGVAKIRGSKYILIKETDTETITIAPLLKAKASNCTADNPLDCVVTIAGTLKIAYKAETNLTGTLYFYDDTNLLQTLVVGGAANYPSSSPDSYAHQINTTDLPSEFQGLKVFYRIQENQVTITAGEKSQGVEITNDMDDAIGYNTIYYYAGAGNNPEHSSLQRGMYLMGDPVDLVKGDIVEIPDTYFGIKYSLTKDIDILRKSLSSSKEETTITVPIIGGGGGGGGGGA